VSSCPVKEDHIDEFLVSDRKVHDERVYNDLYERNFIDAQKKRLEEEATKMVIGIVTRRQEGSWSARTKPIGHGRV